MAEVKIEVDSASVERLKTAMDLCRESSRQSQGEAIKYAVGQFLRHLKPRTKKAKPHAQTKQLEKASAKKVLEVFPFISAKNVNFGREYWLAHSDRKEDNGALIKGWYASTNKHTKAQAAKMLNRKNAGLARASWLMGLRKAKEPGSETGIDGATMAIATRVIEVRFTKNSIGWQCAIRNNLNYATDALTNSNAVNNALDLAASQMLQKLRHSLERKIEKITK